MRGRGFEVLEIRRSNMLPLTITGPVGRYLGGLLWALSGALSRVPLLNRLATNVELVAARAR